MKKLLTMLVVVVVLGACMALGSGPARAQEPAAAGRRGHVIVLPEQHIVGRRQVPVAFLLARSAGHATVVDLRTSFAGEIVRSVRRGPF